jgi:hypothetical protein
VRKRVIFALMLGLMFSGLAHGAELKQHIVRRHISIATRADCPYPWCDNGIKVYTAIAPDDPNIYLGSVISFERPSNWKNFSPLANKVAELTNSLISQRSKITAIANWVRSSKNYAYPNFNPWPPTIEDIWNSPVGVCNEAAFLLTAMLREAGIPAMAISTINRQHEVSRVWDGDIGHWIIVDATFSGANAGPAIIYEWDDYSLVAGFQERPIQTWNNVPIPSSWGSGTIESVTQTQVEVINEPQKLARIGMGYGNLIFPITNKFLYFDSVTKTLSDQGSASQRVSITYRIDAEDNLCLNNKQSWYSNYLGFIFVNPMLRIIDSKYGSGIFQDWGNGYVKTILPNCGTWKISYYFSNQDLNANASGDYQKLATATFSLYNIGDTAIITPDMLEMEPGASQYYFQALVDVLKKLPDYQKQFGGK